jgi:hypothetical protein
MASAPTHYRPSATRRRTGCLGCIGKLIGLLVFGVAFGTLLVLAMDAVFTPWAFYMGGSFHPIPMWSGWGKLQGPSGREYALFVNISPNHTSSRLRPVGGSGPRVAGTATLCSPHGERYSLRLRGSLEKHMGSSTDGKHMSLSLYRRPWNWSFVGPGNERPRMQLEGTWHNPDLVMQDRGSLERYFEADGSLRTGSLPSGRSGDAGVPITLHEGSTSEFEAACAALRH